MVEVRTSSWLSSEELFMFTKLCLSPKNKYVKSGLNELSLVKNNILSMKDSFI